MIIRCDWGESRMKYDIQGKERILDCLPIAVMTLRVNTDGEKITYVIEYANHIARKLCGSPDGVENFIGCDYMSTFKVGGKEIVSLYEDVAFQGGTREYNRFNSVLNMVLKVTVYHLETGLVGVSFEKMHGHIDELTGAHTLDGFKTHMKNMLKSNPDAEFVLWSCDIKNFKKFNESYGFKAGNRIIRTFVSTIKRDLKENEIIGRIEGDKVLILTEKDDIDVLYDRFDIVIRDVRELFDRAKNYEEFQVAVGIRFCKWDDNREDNVGYFIDCANFAKTEAKNNASCQFVIYDQGIEKKETREKEIRLHLSQAIADGEIRPWFQPQYNYATGEIIGAEVLCRWVHPTMGNIYPDEFIRVFEESGQIWELDCYMWECACSAARQWQDKGIRIPLSINLSRVDVFQEDLVEHFLELVKRHGIEKDMLHLEVTESAYVDQTEYVISVVRASSEAGFCVEMDDFGSAYSSLNMLKNMAVSVIKMDLRFIDDLETNVKAGKIVSAVINMAHSMEMHVIAEGVETSSQAEFLRNLNCDYMQGYYFAKPMPKDDFEKLIRE